MTCTSIISTLHSFLNTGSAFFSPAHWEGGARASFELAAAKNSVRPSEGVAGGGDWGEESRHARANKISSQPRRPARQSRTPQKSFVFLLEEKIGRAQKENRKQNFSVVWRELASGGGAASSLGVLRKVSSNFFVNTPPIQTCASMRLGASPLGAGFRQEIPGFFEIHRQHSRRKAAVPKRNLDCAKGARADGERLQIVGVSATPFSNAIL